MKHRMERELQIHNVKISNIKSISTIGVMNTILGQILNPAFNQVCIHETWLFQHVNNRAVGQHDLESPSSPW